MSSVSTAYEVIRAGHALTQLLQELRISREAYDERHRQAEAEGRPFGLEDVRALAEGRRDAVAELDAEIERRRNELGSG